MKIGVSIGINCGIWILNGLEKFVWKIMILRKKTYCEKQLGYFQVKGLLMPVKDFDLS